MIEKLIFLDIDGVLNSRGWYYARQSIPRNKNIDIHESVREMEVREIDPTALALLKFLVDETGAKIVISSTWRLSHDFMYFYDLFADAGIPFDEGTIISCTGVCNRREVSNTVRRGTEIQEWVNEWNFKGKYICIDDDSDFLPCQFHVRCSQIIGFTWNEYYVARQFLGVRDESI